jgi:hypothetical protein
MRWSLSLVRAVGVVATVATAGAATAARPNTDSPDANLVMPFAARGRTSFFALSNVGPGQLAARWTFYDESGELVAEVDRRIVGAGGVDLVDVTRVESEPEDGRPPIDLTGRNGFVVVSGDGQPRLVGNFTIANVATNAAFGGSAVGLGAVGRATGSPLMGTTFSPESLGDDLVIVLGIDDEDAVPTSLTGGAPPTGDVFGLRIALTRGGAFLAGLETAVAGSAVFSSFEDLLPSATLDRSATILISPLGEGVGLVGFYGQALGPFGAGQNFRQYPVDEELDATFPASGQTTPYTADKNGAPGSFVRDDGIVQAGAPLQFVDNGDGTITDRNTGLMWEKKSDDDGLHDARNIYPWSNATEDTIWDWLDEVNAEGGTGFAGYDDWRIPNVKELNSILDFERSEPAVAPAFHDSCTPGCEVVSCSCTFYSVWSSTTVAGSPGSAWIVGLYEGGTGESDKRTLTGARAVRGGS